MRRCRGVSEEGTFRLRGSELGRKKREKLGEFPRCPVVKTWHSRCNGLGSIPERFACKGKEFGFIFKCNGFKVIIFLLWTILKVLTECITILLQFYVSVFIFIYFLGCKACGVLAP